MMDYKRFAGPAEATREPVAFKDAQLQPRVEVATVGLQTSAILPSRVGLAVHSPRHEFAHGGTFRRCHEAVTSALTILGHALPRTVHPVGGRYKMLPTNKAYIASHHIAPFLVHRIGSARQSGLTSVPSCDPLLGFRRAMTRTRYSIFEMALIAAKGAQASLIRVAAIQTAAFKALRLRLAFDRAILALRGHAARHFKRHAALDAGLGDHAAFPIGVQRACSSLAPTVITLIAAEVVGALRLPARSLATFPARITSDLYHTGKYIVLCEVLQ